MTELLYDRLQRTLARPDTHLAAAPLLRPEPSDEPPSSLTASDSVSSVSSVAGHTAITAPARNGSILTSDVGACMLHEVAGQTCWARDNQFEQLRHPFGVVPRPTLLA